MTKFISLRLECLRGINGNRYSFALFVKVKYTWEDNNFCAVIKVRGRELEKAKKWLYVPKNKTLTSCEWKGISLFSSLSREMLTFSRLNVHN